MAHCVWHDCVDSAHSVNKDKSAHTHTTQNSWIPSQGHCIQPGVPRDMCWAACPALTALSKSEEHWGYSTGERPTKQIATCQQSTQFFLICHLQRNQFIN